MLIGANFKAEVVKPLRNPAYRVVEFYAAKLWPGALDQALPIVTNNERITPAIQQIWQWSNWASEKQAVARTFPMCGDLFIKVASKTGRVFLQNLNAENVTDFSTDERGFLEYIRIDVPRVRRLTDGKLQAYTLTEVWDKSTQLFRRWGLTSFDPSHPNI